MLIALQFPREAEPRHYFWDLRLYMQLSRFAHNTGGRFKVWIEGEISD